jgi:putative oxidoreductase
MTSAASSYPTRDTGPVRTVIRIINEAGDWLGRVPLPVIELAMRVGIALVFWKSGMTKIASWDLTVGLFENEYQVPLLSAETAAYLGTANELIASVLLMIGLGTRFGAAALLGLTFVIQVFVYPENWSEHLLWASLLAYFLCRGAGVLSLDHMIARILLR